MTGVEKMMMFSKIKLLISQYWAIYLLGFIIAFGIKLFYSKAASGDLEWILAPTVWWIKTLTGIAFEKVENLGYVNHHFRFIIAPVCSGVQFLVIAFATIFFSFVHRLGTKRRGFYWIALSLGFSYLFTIFVNGFRIILSLHLPKLDIGGELMTAERLHMLMGTAIYFISLLIIYQIARYISLKISGEVKKWPNREFNGSSDKPLWQTIGKNLPPVFWYFAITLGIPILNRAYKYNSEQFWKYAVFLSGISLAIFTLFCLGAVLYGYFAKRERKSSLPFQKMSDII
jgi:exosortase K